MKTRLDTSLNTVARYHNRIGGPIADMDDGPRLRQRTKLSQQDKKRFELEWVLPLEPETVTLIAGRRRVLAPAPSDAPAPRLYSTSSYGAVLHAATTSTSPLLTR